MSEYLWEFKASMSAEILVKKTRCCESRCLHCPYGYTIKKEGFQFVDYEEAYQECYEFIQDKADYQSYKMVTLKKIIIGFIKVNHIIITDMVLRQEFQKQNISKELIEAYFF